MNSRWLSAALLLCACSDDVDPLFVLPVEIDGGAPDAQFIPDAAPTVTDALVPQADASDRDGGVAFLTIDGCGSDNAASLSPDEVSRLRTGDGAPVQPWLYPLPGTVFPRGLRAPLLMWTGGADSRAVLVRIRSQTFSYEGCLLPSADGRVVIPAEVWTQASERGLGKADPFTLEVRELDRTGVVRGRSSASVIVAPGSLKGSLYYNSYSSRLALDQGATGGAVLRIRAGGEAEVFAGQRGCVGCHSVSANGRRLVTSNLADQSNTEGVYALTPETPVNPPSLRAGTDFVGLFPDGSLYAAGLSSYDGSMPGLFETDTGRAITSAELPSTLQHPNFSASGGLLTFMENSVGPDGVYAGSVLATLRFDPAARRFSDYTVRVRGSESRIVDWPSFTPDEHALIYADTARPQLFLHDLENQRDIPLWHAMGYASQAEAEADQFAPNEYGIPSGEHASYYPTIAPVAVGGYFWIFFDTFRSYGNLSTYIPLAPVAPPPLPPDPPSSGLPGWLDDLINGGSGGVVAPPPPIDPGLPPDVPYTPPSRQIWGAAIEVSADGSYTVDPSHPPFYVDGQEIGTNNHRAFAALDPCSARGASCESGIDCCDGFCEQGQCVAPPDRCAKREEACTTHDDCCDGSDRCINGFCSFVDVLR